jgi:hypothetical protein
VLATLSAFPSIPSARIETAFADFKARLEQSGEPLGTYHEFRLRYALHLGDAALVEAVYRDWKRQAKPDDLDCVACWKHLEVRYQLFRNDDEAAHTAAQVLFKRGAPSCNRVPHTTKALMLEPLLRLGRLEEALEHHQDYKRIKDDEGSLGIAAAHMAFLAYLNDVPAALKLFEKHLPWAWRSNDLEERFDTLLNALPVLERLKALAPKKIKLRLPNDFPKHQETGEYIASDLETWIKHELEVIAAQFDARNGNDTFKKAIKVDAGLLEKYSSPVSVKKLRGGK